MNRDEGSTEVIVLGSGTSHGIPMIACTCAVCTSTDPRDIRTRPSIWVRMGERRILVDTGPELRQQCVTHKIDTLDAVLYTHHHADHVVGLDDLRRYNWLMEAPLPCYANQLTTQHLENMFGYAFKADSRSPHSPPKLQLKVIDAEPFNVGDQTIIPIPLLHGTLPVLGFRFGRFAYCTDCNSIPQESLTLLENLDVLMIDGLRRMPHPTHFNLEQAVEMARIIKPRQTYFTHIAHQLGHAEGSEDLPQGMALAYDGLRFTI
ncbi:MAG: MBL fold metallo-hydrolase [Phycisphaerales bacterium]|nr:MAG: MBL fold metallo-hydrolase [Phycisphaerales bacterium]